MGNLATLQDRLRRRVREIVTKKVKDPAKWRALGQAIWQAWDDELAKLPVSNRFKDAYLRCLRVDVAVPGRVVVAFDTTRASPLDAMFARAVEYGVRPGGIDMKKWLLAGRPYRDIPIEQTSNTTKMQATKKSGGMESVEQKLKMLGGGKKHRMPEGEVKKLRTGTQLTPEQHSTMKGQLIAGTAGRKTMPKYGHVTDPLAQAFRQTTSYHSPTAAGGTGRSYGKKGSIFVIRRISQKSDPRSWHWMRRGMRGAHLAKKMRKLAKTLAAEILLG